MDNELPNIEGGIPILSQGQVLEFPSNTQVDDSNAQVDETEDEIVDDIVNEMDKLSIIDNAEPALKEETEKTPQQEEFIDQYGLKHSPLNPKGHLTCQAAF